MLMREGLRRLLQEHDDMETVGFQLTGGGQFAEVSVPSRLLLKGGKTVLLQLRGQSEVLDAKRNFDLHYVVTNLKITPEDGLDVTFPVEIGFVPAK